MSAGKADGRASVYGASDSTSSPRALPIVRPRERARANRLAQLPVARVALAEAPGVHSSTSSSEYSDFDARRFSAGSTVPGASLPRDHQEAGVGDHPVVRPHREPLDVPAAHHASRRLRFGERDPSPGWPRRPSRAGSRWRCSTIRMPPGTSALAHASRHSHGASMSRMIRSALAGRHTVPSDSLQVADLHRPVRRHAAGERRDVAARRPRRSRRGARTRSAVPGRRSARSSHRLRAPEPDPGLDHGRAREDVGLRNDLRGVLRVDDGGTARHGHHEVGEPRSHREVLEAVGAGQHARVGQTR